MSGVESSEVHGDVGAFYILTGFRICPCTKRLIASDGTIEVVWIEIKNL
jgi:hypothetical protein